MKELYNSITGSHAWQMERPDSDFDFWVIYQAPSRSFLLGNTHHGGHETKGIFTNGIKWDKSSFEIGQHVRDLMGGNINHVVCLLSPSTNSFNGEDPDDVHKDIIKFDDKIDVTFNHPPKKRSAYLTPEVAHTRIKLQLRKLFLSNPSKNVYKSINGMTTHNINAYFVPRHRSGKPNPKYLPDTVNNNFIRRKKIGQIRRLLEFGYHVLIDEKYELRPVDVQDGSDGEVLILKQWQEDLQHAYNASDLPKKPDAEPFKELLMDLRMEDLHAQ